MREDIIHKADIKQAVANLGSGDETLFVLSGRGPGHYARDCRNQPYEDNWAYVNNYALTNIGNGPNSGMHDRQKSNLSPSAASFYPQRGENVSGPSQVSAGDLTNSKQNSSN